MPIAVVALDFDPTMRFDGWSIRLETLGFAAAVLVALLVGGLVARRTPTDGVAAEPLRLDDLLFVALSAIPGAVIAGRIGYVLLHLDYYRANPGALADPGRGSLELGMAVGGAALTGAFAGRVLTGRIGPWLHAAAVPTLLAIGIGKVAAFLGGSGQGAPSQAPWATAYLGPGPWGALAPATPAHPSQLYEAAAVGLVALVVVGLATARVFHRRDGLAWLVGVGGWLVARTLIASTWRDADVLGPLKAGQLIAIGLLLAVALVGVWVAPRTPGGVRVAAPEPRWRDRETRARS